MSPADRPGLGVTVGAAAPGPATRVRRAGAGWLAAWAGARRLAGAAGSFVRQVVDPGPVLRADRARWAGASSLAELGELTAAWLRGEIASQPGYHGPVDVDEDLAPGLTAALVAVNRAGAVTTGSQAGLVDGEYVQLAWVVAFMDDALLARLQDAAAGTGYRVIVHVPGTRWVPVTWDRGKVWTGSNWMDAQYWAWHYEGVGDGALEQVLAAHQVSVIDPVPGRNTMWAWLGGAVAAAGRAVEAATRAGAPVMHLEQVRDRVQAARRAGQDPAAVYEQPVGPLTVDQEEYRRTTVEWDLERRWEAAQARLEEGLDPGVAAAPLGPDGTWIGLDGRLYQELSFGWADVTYPTDLVWGGGDDFRGHDIWDDIDFDDAGDDGDGAERAR